MNRRPLPITVLSWMFIAAGTVGFAYHATEFNPRQPIRREWVLIMILRLLAILGGVFLLRGRGWARWLLIIWLAYHVILSAFHNRFELVVHGLLFVVLTCFLCCRQASAYFQKADPRV